jgi:nicotinate-nucleotide pyrophosphorylase (carboxylating)
LIVYSQQTTLDEKFVRKQIAFFMQEDMPDGDKTTESTIGKDALSTAEIQAVEDMVFVGEHVIPFSFGTDCDVYLNPSDGDDIKAGDIIGTITGPSRAILSYERVMLNLTQRLCGIATNARMYSELAKPFKVKILDTRKTTPGLRLFEKYAVCCGGAFNHRLNLSTGVLIKDNHLKSAGSIAKAVSMSKQEGHKLHIELEVDTLAQVKEGLSAGVDGFLLDNMSPKQIQEAIAVIRQHPGGDSIFVEASGGITIENIHGYLDTGINAISIGALTHAVKSRDIRLEFIR